MQVESNIKILMGYVHKFEYRNEEEASVMCGHPLPGRVYRIIKDENGYRLHIGKENNEAGLDGWLLGKRLKNSLRSYSFDIEEITPASFEELKLHPEDVSKMVHWLNTGNKDLIDYLTKVDVHPITSDMVGQLRALLRNQLLGSPVLPDLTGVPVDEPKQMMGPMVKEATLGLISGTEITVYDIDQVYTDANTITIIFRNGSTCIYPMMHVLYIHQNS